MVKVALDVHTSEMAGDILVFLTGKQQIIVVLMNKIRVHVFEKNLPH